MPSDILGTEVLRKRRAASARSLLRSGFRAAAVAGRDQPRQPRGTHRARRAMQEHHVTVAGARYDLPTPFHVLATQNPLEQEGTYPLPRRNSTAS